MRNVLKRTDKYFWFATAIIAAGCAVRLFALGSIPCGLNQDEAFAGYNAWALLHYGVDSSGYHNPVYFTAWGSGMNALESYLMIPFVALFGTGTAVLRLPQALMACLSLICVYDLGKHISGRRFALCAVAVLATSPWHIMMARWALESNLPLLSFYWGCVSLCVGYRVGAGCMPVRQHMVSVYTHMLQYGPSFPFLFWHKPLMRYG